MITFHSRRSDCARRARKNEYSGTFNFVSQIASSICTIAFTKREKSDAIIFTSRRSRLSLICNFRQGHALLLSQAKVFRLANGSSKNRRSPARRPRNGRESSGKTSGEMPRRFSHICRELPGCGKCNAAECQGGNLQDNSQDGEHRSRNVRVAVRATADATSREISRKMTARNSPITISNLSPKNYELITINTQP
jgi:hypothetical protein